MPDSGAVYQPTTVGYTYDSAGDGAGSSNRIRSGFLRIMSRHKISSRKWIEWVLLSIAVAFFVAGLGIITINIPPSENSMEENTKIQQDVSTTAATEVEIHVNSETKRSVALGIGMMLVGLLLGSGWTWLHFFCRSKPPRNGITGGSGQMLGGLNPSTDLLVGSTSQYGPVLTELPSQLKLKQLNSHEAPVVPLSDQEEETRTLMQDSTVASNISVGPNTVTNQLSG